MSKLSIKSGIVDRLFKWIITLLISGILMYYGTRFLGKLSRSPLEEILIIVGILYATWSWITKKKRKWYFYDQE